MVSKLLNKTIKVKTILMGLLITAVTLAALFWIFRALAGLELICAFRGCEGNMLRIFFSLLINKEPL